ncbi:MAG TPA: sialidase family protein, partial [Pyrinomonadaceae bacterium]|nr:sialidase family protein [Pyrinomonadaceae bacterium]
MHVKTVFLILFALSAVVPQIGCTSTPVADSRSRSSNETSPAAAVRVSDVGSKAAETAIAVDSGGNIYVAYVEHAEDKSADLFVHKYDASLKSISPAVQINPVKGAVKAWYGDPPTIAVAPDKTIYVGWTMRNGGGIDYVVSGSRDGGQTFGEPTKINDDAAPASHGMHSIAVDAGGTIYAAWLDERNVHKVAEHGSMNRPAADGFQIVKIDHKGTESEQAPEPNSEVFFAVSADGGKTFSKNQRIASEVCPCCKTAVIANEGRVYVSWRQVLDGDHRHIAVASSTD